MTGIALATEDELSEAIGLRLIGESPFANESPLLLRRNGFGYLRSKMNSWRQMADRQAVLVLTDLDRISCPIVLLDNWSGSQGALPRNLMLRIAVREVESWVLADHDGMRQLIGVRGQLPQTPDLLPDPKQHLLGLARLAPRAVRQDMIADRGAVASQGIGYNRRLVHWVSNVWSPDRAAQRSPSLQRARMALARLSP